LFPEAKETATGRTGEKKMEKNLGQVSFMGYTCDVLQKKYTYSNNNALRLVVVSEDPMHDNEPMCTASVNIHGVQLEADEVIIKNYSENEGVQEALLDAGIIVLTGKRVATGFVECDICKIIV
jgi:hypothetical protein